MILFQRRFPDGFFEGFYRILDRKWSRAGTPNRLKIYKNSLRSAHARRPICTLRIYTFLVLSLLAQQAPCECSHPGWGGPRDPKEGPQGPRDGARADARCARGRADARAARALGPFGPLGPLGAEGDRLYATKALPNGIDNTRRTLFRMESIQAEENVRKNPNIYRVRMT